MRNAATYYDPLFVITGPLFEKDMPALPRADEPHKVPSGYFKVVYDKKGKAAYFQMNQNISGNADYCSSIKSKAIVELKLGFYLPSLQDHISIKARLGC